MLNHHSYARIHVRYRSVRWQRICSPGFLEEFFSENQKTIREEKGRGVENPGGKVSWTLGSCVGEGSTFLPSLLF